MPATTCTAFPQLQATTEADAEKDDLEELSSSNIDFSNEIITSAWAELLRGYTGHDEVRFLSDTGTIEALPDRGITVSKQDEHVVDATSTGVFFKKVRRLIMFLKHF